MSDVTRAEFDALVNRVAELESLGERTWSMIGHVYTSLREVHDKLGKHDVRFDNLDRKLDNLDHRLDETVISVADIDRKLDETVISVAYVRRLAGVHEKLDAIIERLP